MILSNPDPISTLRVIPDPDPNFKGQVKKTSFKHMD